MAEEKHHLLNLELTLNLAIASFHKGRVVQGIVNDGQRTFPFLLDGIFICIWLVQICSSYDDGYFELSGEFISTFRSMSVILVNLDSCRRYLAVDNPAIPPPRIIMCSLLLLFFSSSVPVLNFLITPRRIGECSTCQRVVLYELPTVDDKNKILR